MSEVKAYLESLDMSVLPANVADKISMIIKDDAVYDYPDGGEEFTQFKSMLESKYPNAVPGLAAKDGAEPTMEQIREFMDTLQILADSGNTDAGELLDSLKIVYGEEMAHGGGVGVGSKLTEKDFIENKEFIKNGVLIKLEKLSNPKSFRANYIDANDNEKIGSYSSPYSEDVIHDIYSTKYAKGGVLEVKDGEDTFYLTYIDSTHFYLSNSPDFKGSAYHIGQFRGRPFYNQIDEWLKSHKGMYANGGAMGGLNLTDLTVHDYLQDYHRWGSMKFGEDYRKDARYKNMASSHFTNLKINGVSIPDELANTDFGFFIHENLKNLIDYKGEIASKEQFDAFLKSFKAQIRDLFYNRWGLDAKFSSGQYGTTWGSDRKYLGTTKEQAKAIVEAVQNMKSWDDLQYSVKSNKYAKGGGIENKQKYEIVFEDVFSFATVKREAELTDSQYKIALEQKADNVIVVDKYDASKGIHEQLRIKDIKPKYAKGGGMGGFYAVTKFHTGETKLVPIKKVSFYHNGKFEHEPTMRNLESFFSQVPFDEMVCIYDNERESDGELHSAHTPLFTSGAKKVHGIVDESGKAVKFESFDFYARGGRVGKKGTKSAFGLLDFEALESIFNTTLFGLDEDETEETLDELRAEWNALSEKERIEILNEYVGSEWKEQYARGGGVGSNQLSSGTRIEFLKRIFVDSQKDYDLRPSPFPRPLYKKRRNVDGKILKIDNKGFGTGIIELVDTDMSIIDKFRYYMSEREIRELERKGWIKIDNSKYGKLGKVTEDDLKFAKSQLSFNREDNKDGIYFDGEKWILADKDKRRSSYNYMEEFVEKLNQNKVTEADLEKYARGGGVGEFNVGQSVIIRSDNDNENYEKYRGKELVITHKATSEKEHRGYDSGMEGQGLYDFILRKTGEQVPFSLYDYEIEQYAKGGDVEMVDLFEDYDNIPSNIQVILDKYSDAFTDGDYNGLSKALKEVEAKGYTFEFDLGGEAFGLRPKNVPLNKLKGYENSGDKYAKGGGVGENHTSEFGNGGSIGSIHYHKHNPNITLEILDYTNKGIKGLQKNPKSLSAKERKQGIIVYYSTNEFRDLFEKDKYAKGGGVGETKHTKYQIRIDLLQNGVAVPVGDGYVSSGIYEGRYRDEDTFEIKHNGEWKVADSIDWETVNEYAKGGRVSKIKAVRNEDVDYFVNEDFEWDDNGKIKMYAIEIQNESGDVIDYESARSEREAQKMIERINRNQKYAKGGAMAEGESYEYVNTFGIDDTDFQNMVDAYHNAELPDTSLTDKYGEETISRASAYIHATHQSNIKK